jgi:hypothetical protein
MESLYGEKAGIYKRKDLNGILVTIFCWQVKLDGFVKSHFTRV